MSRSQAPRRILPRPGAVGAALVLAAVIVLLAAALNTSMLGPDPALAFDCNDTTCEDLWIDAWMHHREVALWTLPAFLGGWVLLGLGRLRGSAPSAPDRARLPVPSTGTRIGATAVRAGALLVAMVALSTHGLVLLLLGPIPLLVGALVLASICIGVATALLQRAGVGRRAAWFLGGAETGVGAGLLVIGLPRVIGPAGLEMWRLVLVQATVAILVSALHEGLAIAGARRARRIAHAVEPAGRPSLAPSARVGEAAAVIVLALLVVWASSPVAAPPQDVRSQGEWMVVPEPQADPVVVTPVEIPSAAARPPLVGTTPAPEPPELQGLPSDAPYEGVLLAPGARATAELSWPGYRDAADTTTPQTAGIRLADGTLATASSEGRGGSGSRAPLDIVDGAVIEVGRWQVV
ncbi:hypothetical protein ACT3TZ_06205 [Brachybacterium sp. AOP25-B2-12]|uniref:hypothetical protein n=1 Tax=Brachybacterium sp. AOP25-B2-12 TaxID=3457710 RepID=UPI004034F6E8